MNRNRLLAVLVMALAVLGCERQPQSTPASDTPASAAAAAQPQRYQLFFSPHARADTFLVDTQKGRVWVLTKYVDFASEPSAFDEVEIVDSTGEVGMKFSEFMRIYSSPQAAEGKGKKTKSPVVSDDPGGKSSESKGVKK